MRFQKTTIPLDLELTIEARLTLFGRIGFFLLKLGSWLLSKSCVSVKVVE
jgi:hypothetical protein